MEDWKDKLSSLYGAVPKADGAGEAPTPAAPAGKHTLRVELDKRNGKPATLITEFAGSDEELKALSVKLRAMQRNGGLKPQKKENIQPRQPGIMFYIPIDPDAPKC